MTRLPSVHETVTLLSFVAEDQEDKLFLIEELDLILGAQLQQFDQELAPNDQHQALIQFAQTLEKELESPKSNTSSEIVNQLLTTIRSYIQQADIVPDPTIEYSELEQNLLGLLPYTMKGKDKTIYPTSPKRIGPR